MTCFCDVLQNVLLPIPAGVNVSNQLQDYLYQGASAKPDGLLGFLHEAFSILPQGEAPSGGNFYHALAS